RTGAKNRNPINWIYPRTTGKTGINDRNSTFNAITTLALTAVRSCYRRLINIFCHLINIYCRLPNIYCRLIKRTVI
uniref:Uncharacterized protein n=1 Tax=Anopheles atroparvus TaxID=41427 RepID=A0AAG5DKG8_ANOAO